ncbi:MAG TPA: DUF1634 domain-containing protein [Bryobacteraceae bacterium]|jgi:uncharacterized membrane protein|nr:DUF1634 domain-containing protein [Bryobacteraceae bacterium]
MTAPQISDKAIERLVSVVLRSGVLISAFVVLAGGIYFLILHGDEIADYRTFRGEPSIDRIIGQILRGAIDLRARSIIQAGILLLLATPIARVVVSLIGFALEPDGKYVAITAIVLAVLLYSLSSGMIAG